MKRIETVIDGLNEEFAPGPSFHESVMGTAYMRSPDIKAGTTPARAARTLVRAIRLHSRKVRYVYAAVFDGFVCNDGRRFITACVFVLKHKT